MVVDNKVEPSDYRSFCQFIAYFHMILKEKSSSLTAKQIQTYLQEKIFFTMKKRCLVQTICSNKHPHLLQEVVMTKRKGYRVDLTTLLFNKNVDLNTRDANDQSPILAALRQVSGDFASIMLETIEQEYQRHYFHLKHARNYPQRIPYLNHYHLKHGYPLHVSLLSHKFDITLRILKLIKPPKGAPNQPKFIYSPDPAVKSSIGANIVHLLLVKYDKDPKTCK